MTALAPAITPLFATSLAVTALAAGELPALRDAIATARSRERPADPARAGQGWRSAEDMARWGSPAVGLLVQQLAGLAEQLTIDVASSGTPRYRWSVLLRANMLRAGETMDIRHRPDAYWGGQCVIDDGYGGITDPAAGGEIEIEDPRLPATLMEAPDLRLRQKLGPGGATYRETAAIRPSAGQLLLYPAWLRIAHRPFRGPAERMWITIDLVAHRTAPSSRATVSA